METYQLLCSNLKACIHFFKHSMSKYLKAFGMNETTGRIIDIRHLSRRMYAYFISLYIYIYSGYMQNPTNDLTSQ